jgi:hypothetical protein
VEAILKRKYREAMRAAARERNERPDDEAEEACNWFDEWAARTVPPQEQPIESQQQN